MSVYGCHNRAPFAASHPVQDGWQPGRNMREQPFVMARDCQFTKTELGRVDPKCQGCKWQEKILQSSAT